MAEEPQVDRVVDFDSNDKGKPVASKDAPITTKVKLQISRPHVRKWLAYGITLIFAFEVIGGFVAFFIGKEIDDIKALLLEVLGPTSALVGSAVGFYFGSAEE